MHLIEHDSTPVHVRGEPLHQIYWRGRQWAVTSYGIERLNGAYAIAAADLKQLWWPGQIIRKTWVDQTDFLTAWLVALPLHSVRISAAAVHAAIAEAQEPRKPLTDEGEAA